MKSDHDLIRACKLWDKITTKMHNGDYEMPEELEHYGKNQPYTGGDYNPLGCMITGKKAELTVGSASGHKAHVDLEKGELEYYDNDESPNQVMNDLLEEEAGLKCEVNYDGVKCKGVTKQNVDEVFRILAMPTSMDFRLNHCERETGEDPEEMCRDTCIETLESNFNVPYTCDCTDWVEECVSDCVSDYEPESSVDCQEIEKQFFREGAKNEKLTKKEAVIPSKSQTKLGEY